MPHIWKLMVPGSELALRVVVVYLFVLIGLRLSGKREVGQMTPFDLVLLLLLSNAVQNTMTGPDTSLAAGLLAAALLLVLNRAINLLSLRSRFLARLLKGHASVLVRNGHLIESHLAIEGITHDELLAALREHGVATLDSVRLAVLEIDGSISVIRSEDSPTAEKRPRRVRILKHH